jgi:hypothetical protein
VRSYNAYKLGNINLFFVWHNLLTFLDKGLVMSELEMKKLEVDIMETMANIKKMGAETANLSAETARINKNNHFGIH